MRLLETLSLWSKRGTNPICASDDHLNALKSANKRKLREQRCSESELKVMTDVKESVNLHITPRMAEYSASKGGGSRHLLVNVGTESYEYLLVISITIFLFFRIVIKVKCSNNDLYRVSPVYSSLNPGKTLRLYIARDPGPAKVDKLVLIYMKSMCRNPREAFSNDIQNESNERRKALIALAAHDLTRRLRIEH